MVTAANPYRVSDIPILLVEDDEGDAVLVRASLAEAGMGDGPLTWSRTLAQALDALRTTRPAVVLLDLGLPDTDGYRAIHEMVEAAPEVAVIVLTGRLERDGVDALSAGAQDYLVKDTITGELLERSIRYAIERKRAQRARQQLRDMQLNAAERARLERGLLPSPVLRTEAVSCATYYQPGRDGAVLGGDFFDVVEIADGRVRAMIGDVMGHGPDEAALGVHLRVAWRSLLLAGVAEERMLPSLALLLGAEDVDHHHYATVCDVTIDQPGQEVVLRVAGHPAPVRCAAGDAQYLPLEVGPPLGLPAMSQRPPDWPANRVSLPSGSSLLLYTDGLLEAYTAQADAASIGIGELVAAVAERVRSGQPASSWISTLVGGAPNESLDDTALVMLTVK